MGSLRFLSHVLGGLRDFQSDNMGLMLNRYMEDGIGSLWDSSTNAFFSPLESPEDSGDEMEEGSLVRIPKRFKRRHPLTGAVSILKYKSR